MSPIATPNATICTGKTPAQELFPTCGTPRTPKKNAKSLGILFGNPMLVPCGVVLNIETLLRLEFTLFINPRPL